MISLVIKIPEDYYEALRKTDLIISGIRSEETLMSVIYGAVAKGTPLSKGHGRLIDADALIKKMEEREEKLKDDRSMWETASVETALDMFAPTIIEADKAESEENNE
jgi:hypothetical protein